MSIHAFDAARMNGYRGFFLLPDLEPSKRITNMSRAVVCQKVQWLYDNFDALRVAVDALTREEVGTGLWPSFKSSSREFNRRATNLFHNNLKDPRFFDLSAKRNFYEAQWLFLRYRMRYGECFAQEVTNPDTHATLLNFINPWRIGNPTGSAVETEWQDGILTDRFGRALTYRVLNKERDAVEADVAALDIIHFHTTFDIDQQRAMSPLTPVVSKLFTIDDIERAETSGVLLRTKLAYAFENLDDGAQSLLDNTPGTEKVQELKTPNGTIQIRRIRSQDGSGRDTEVLDLPARKKLVTVESNRAAGTVDFIQWLLGGLANCTLYPKDYVFHMGGLTQGTSVRMLGNRVKTIKNAARESLQTQFCEPFTRWWTWHRIMAGAFNGIEIPSDWWNVKWIFPADDSVDIGREGAMYDKRLKEGIMSPDDYYGMQGRDPEDVYEEIVDGYISRQTILDERRAENPNLDLDYASIFAPAQQRTIKDTEATEKIEVTEEK